LSGGRVITYTIDGEGRRLSRFVDGVFHTGYMHDTSGRLVAEVESSGQLRSHFVYATESHSPDYMIKGGAKFYFAKDQLGSIRAVINADTGVVAQAIHYDEFGRVLSDTSPGFQPFGFAGGLYDPDTKLTLFGARSYDAEVGRWLSKDPIGFNGGDTNLYGYVLNDPVNLVDPSGLYALCDGIRCSTDGTRPVSGWIGATAPIGTSVDIVFQSRQKGERNQTANPGGTSNPFKHMKPDPNDPSRVIRKDPHTGKPKSSQMPDGFKDWWNKRHPGNQCK
jgi:RHS repeat-associated protein